MCNKTAHKNAADSFRGVKGPSAPPSGKEWGENLPLNKHISKIPNWC